MKCSVKILLSLLPFMLLMGFNDKEKIVTVYLVGDSTMADYSDDYDPGKDYMKTRYPVTGWGQVFQPFMSKEHIADLKGLINADSIVVDDRARGGRSTRTFFEEGRWRDVYTALEPDDVVLMQFGHNDAAESKPARYVTPEGYKEYIRLFVSQARDKGGIPIIVTPVNRNYPWKDGQLQNVHGEYYTAAVEVAKEMKARMIDLTKLSMEHFSEMGKDYVTSHYFMNFEAGLYEAYPDGSNDNTHFQPEGARAVAKLVYEAMIELAQEIPHTPNP
ncbi:rhamnogalacturonan acetylesterase [Echinicola vietnamensis]|uniref:Lysophospholipase L1-like esterase n=1 Tax=Echinicola vietnamensis (strain DSM 17526 / LMG 23754 / KMM 6221) TaxID=926556 RepID=L0FZF8_ECHVK|nr:GDSL-type esterase/lipase family protein [Echinicola vietnamensis]AGA79319.1 lysophospholipase L1-like esterase [Echinicola vietnamensis DSM 17526]